MAGAMPCGNPNDCSRCVCLFLARGPVNDVLDAAQCCDGTPLASLATCIACDAHPNSSYTRRVLTAALRRWEAAGDSDENVVEELHEHLAAALLREAAEDAVWMHRRFTLSSGAAFWVKASSDYLAAQTSGFVWPCGLELARLALRTPQMFNGHRILELGAGTGVAALVLATHTLPAALFVSDANGDAAANIAANFQLNAVPHHADADAWHASKAGGASSALTWSASTWADAWADERQEKLQGCGARRVAGRGERARGRAGWVDQVLCHSPWEQPRVDGLVRTRCCAGCAVRVWQRPKRAARASEVSVGGTASPLSQRLAQPVPCGCQRPAWLRRHAR